MRRDNALEPRQRTPGLAWWESASFLVFFSTLEVFHFRALFSPAAVNASRSVIDTSFRRLNNAQVVSRALSLI